MRPTLIWTATFAALAFIPLTLAAQTVDTIDPALVAASTASPTQVLEQTGVPSASVAVVKGGKLVYTHAYGSARLATDTASAVPATPEMRYSIGSISKQFTAAAILLLQQEGKLSLDDPVGKYIPGLTQGDKVTIRQILSHTSGYQDYWPEDYVMTPMLQPESPPADPRHLGQKASRLRARHPVAILQHQLRHRRPHRRKRHRSPLMDFLVEHIFRPLGMNSVWNSDETKLTQADATPYYRHALGPLRLAPKEGRGWMFAAGELAMTAHDLALWDESLIAQSSSRPRVTNRMFTEVKLNNGKGTHYGLGVYVSDRDGHRSSSTAAKSPASSQTMKSSSTTASP